MDSHPSLPHNPDIANAFFRSGYIESWGRGIEKITNQCIEAKLPKPLFYYKSSGFWVEFRKDIYFSDYLKSLELNDRQVKAVLYVKEKGKITNSEYQTINNVKKSVAATELQDLSNRAILIKVGLTGRSTKYTIPE